MNFFGGWWRRQTAPPVTDINTEQIRARIENPIRMEVNDIRRATQALADEVARTFGEQNGDLDMGGWTVNVTHDYIDATTFGDVTRTYVGGDAHWVVRNAAGVFVAQGTIDQAHQMDPVDWNRLLAEQAEQRKQMEEATERSKKLLRRYITDKQWEQLRGSGMTIKGKGGIVYLIDSAGLVSTIKPKYGTFCVYPTDRTMPKWDKVLTMKLWIENREEEFLAAANWSGAQYPVGLVKLGLNGRPDGVYSRGFTGDRTAARYGNYLTS